MSGVQEIRQGISRCYHVLCLKPTVKLLQSNTINGKGLSPFAMKTWVTPVGKELRPGAVLAESGGNTEWAVEEGSYKDQLRSCDQLQK